MSPLCGTFLFSCCVLEKQLLINFAFIPAKENWQLIPVMQETKKKKKRCQIYAKACQIFTKILGRKMNTLWMKGKKDFFNKTCIEGTVCSGLDLFVFL